MQPARRNRQAEIWFIHKTNQLLVSSWSWALLEKSPIMQLLQSFPGYYGIRRFTAVFTRALHWSSFWARWIKYIPSHPVFVRSVLKFSRSVGIVSLRTKATEFGFYADFFSSFYDFQKSKGSVFSASCCVLCIQRILMGRQPKLQYLIFGVIYFPRTTCYNRHMYFS
jgi:hypothetical protein